MHMVILGDGTLNNRPCCRPGLSLVERLADRMGRDDRVTVLASRGMPLEGIPFQVALIPEDATHAVVAVGLESECHGDPWSVPAIPVDPAVMDGIVVEFGTRYRSVVAELQRRELEVIVLGMPRREVLDPEGVLPGAGEWLDRLNDETVAVAEDGGATFLDLRPILTTPGDYHGTEGPSEAGGYKLAGAIRACIRGTAEPAWMPGPPPPGRYRRTPGGPNATASDRGEAQDESRMMVG